MFPASRRRHNAGRSRSMHTAESGARTLQSGTETDNAASWNRNRHKLQAGPGASTNCKPGPATGAYHRYAAGQFLFDIGAPFSQIPRALDTLLGASYLHLACRFATFTCPQYAADQLQFAIGMPPRSFHLPSIRCQVPPTCPWRAAPQCSLALDTLLGASNLPLARRSLTFTCPRYAGGLA